MWGTIVNSVAIIAGSLLGFGFGSRFSESSRAMVMQAIGLGVFLVGLQMVITSEQVVIVLISLVVGGWLGEKAGLEAKLEDYGRWLGRRVGKVSSNGDFVQAFVTATLLYCVGAMAIVGAIESGLVGNHSTLYAKSIIDGITSIVLAASLGIGVMFSAISVLLYQGAITIAASWMQFFLTEPVINELRATGGLIIIGISLNILKITKIRVGNLIPAIFIVVVLMLALEKIL